MSNKGEKRFPPLLQINLIIFQKIANMNYIEKLNAAINDHTITTLSLNSYNIGNAGVTALAQVLKDTKITTLVPMIGQWQGKILVNTMIDNKLKQLKLVDNLSDILRPDSNDNLEFYINNTDNVMESVMNVIKWIESVQGMPHMKHSDIMRSRFVCLIKAKYNISEEQITNFAGTGSIMYKLLEFIGMHTAGVDDYAKILSQCEGEKGSKIIMKELLFHRICIPETKILHPLVLTLLSKYDMLTLSYNMLNPTEWIEYYKNCGKDVSDAAINVVCKAMLEYYERNLELLNTPKAIDLLGEQVPIV